ncbi:MAG TPA: HAMP domain-containing sensor histidine kinase [Clostridia bacterium]
MKRATIKWKIFSFNVFTFGLLLLITAVAFNIFARIYMENQTLNQLRTIAGQVREETGRRPPRRTGDERMSVIGPYIALTRAIRQPHSVFSAEVALVDKNMNLLAPYVEFTDESTAFEHDIVSFILSEAEKKGTNEITLTYSGDEYAAIIVPFEYEYIGKIIVYTSMEKVKDLQKSINLILLAILLVSALIVTLVSSYLSRKISTPLSKLCKHIRDLSERQFSSRIQIPAEDEILELVNNINNMAEKLETYDKAQKTFMQNVSHELRTPIMSIRSYAEGIRYGVVENDEAVRVILEETNRLTKLVEDLIYLSRLDSIEETYHMEYLDFHELLHFCTTRMKAIAKNQGKEICVCLEPESIFMFGDEEKLTRAVTNLLDNSIRYAKSKVILSSRLQNAEALEFTITDDGPGFDADEIEHVFTRFYKGKKGHFGLGLSITKSIIEKHKGTITAENVPTGAVIKVILPVRQDKSAEQGPVFVN